MSPAKPHSDKLDDVFGAIGDPTRRGLLDQLRTQPMNTTALCATNDGMTRTGVINHIRILEAAELIRVEERGRERINHLNAARLQDICDRWLTPFEQIWTSHLGNLTHAAQTNAANNSKETPMATPPVRVVEITQQRSCAATPAQIWQTLTNDVDQWWDRSMRPDDSEAITLTLEPGGTLFDARPDNAGYVLASVRGYKPPRELILDGEFGLPGAMHGRLVIAIEPTDSDATTTVTFTNHAIGAIPDDLDAHQDGWALLVHRLCDRAQSAANEA